MTNKQEKLIAMRLPLALLKRIDRLAKQEDRSRSAIARRLMVAALAAQKPEATK